MMLTIPPATSAMASPTAAYKIVFLPSETFSGSPEDVISLNAPTSTIMTDSGAAISQKRNPATAVATLAKVSFPPRGSVRVCACANDVPKKRKMVDAIFFIAFIIPIYGVVLKPLQKLGVNDWPLSELEAL